MSIALGEFKKRRDEGRDENDYSKTLKLKVRKLNPINTTSYVQILGTDSSTAVFLFFDQLRIIFNAGEGLQRICMEHKIKLSKIDHIFLSRVCSETTGGIPGVLLTLSSMGKEGMSVKISGPPDLKHLVDAMRSFIPRSALDKDHICCFGVNCEADGSCKFVDPIILINEGIKLSAIIVKPNSQGFSQHMKDDSTLSVLSSVGLDEEIDQLSKPSLSHPVNSEKNGGVVRNLGNISVIYVCELPKIQGKFDPAKALALGLKPGPKYRQLQLGKTVKSDMQDIMVHPSDVLGPSVPGPVVLIVDCPTLSHLEELKFIQSLSSYFKSVNCIIHLSPSSITHTATYQEWMRNFVGAQHIMAGHGVKNMEIPILNGSTRVAARLNYLCPKFFPPPCILSLEDLPENNTSTEGSVLKLLDIISAENLLKFHLRPYTQLGLDRSAIPNLLDHKEIVNELISEIPEVVESVEQLSHLCIDPTMTRNSFSINKDDYESIPTCLKNIGREDMEIILLGTGSSQPSKYRNVSSIYVNLFSKGGLLLDCGEGTLGQLKRRYGVTADDVVRGLRCIWISHIHADHHTGLAGILALRCELLTGIPHEPVLVIGPAQLKCILDVFQKIKDLDMQFLDCIRTTEHSLAVYESSLASSSSSKRSSIPIDTAADFLNLKKLKKVVEELHLEALVSVPVVHCQNAFGLVLKAAERNNTFGKVIPGWKLVYSGDTRPCPQLIDASREATVLIHEATFEDGMVDEAIAKNHSTIKEAIEVGEDAYRIVLTHFSQRYPKIPVIDETQMHKTCIAFDLMSINIADLPVLPKVLPHLKLLFKNETMADESDDIGSSLM